MNYKNIVLAVIFSMTFWGQYAFAQKADDYGKGWDAFMNNNRAEARSYFTKACDDPERKSDARLSLCYLDWIESKDDSAFVNFQKFYAESSNPYPYFYAMSSLPFLSGNKNAMDSLRLAFYEKINKDPQLNGTLKAMICQQLGDHYTDCNQLKTAKEFYDKIGAIGNWQILGPFENISGSGYDKDWGAISKVSSGEMFVNKNGAQVKWYTPSSIKSDFWFYFNYYFVLDGIIAYAQTFVDSPQEQDVFLRTGTSGSLKIWLNDALVSAIPEERNCDLDIYSYKVKLNRGKNRIVVQIGQSEIDGGNFLVRITDEKANPVQGLRYSSEPAAYEKSKLPTQGTAVPFFAEAFFEKRIKEDGDNPLNYFALAEVYLRNDKAFEATDILKQLSRKGPKSTLVHYRLMEAYLRSDNETSRSIEVENIRTTDPNSFFALQQAYLEAFQAEKYADAEAICKKTVEMYGKSLSTESWYLQLASSRKNMDELVSRAESLYAKYPYNEEYMDLNYRIQENVLKNSKAALTIVEDYCKKYFSPKALETLSDIYTKQGNQAKGLEVLTRRLEAIPYATGYFFDYANTLYQMRKYDEALAVTDRIEKLAPYLPGLYNTRGYIYKEMKDEAKAKENFQKSIYYAPTSYDSRSQLRLLEKKKEVFDLFPSYSLDSLISVAPNAEKYPESNSLMVLYDNQLVVYPEGATEHHVELAVKILNTSAIEQWKEYDIGYAGNQKLWMDKYEVIKANGQKVKAETDGRGKIVFTNLEVGDVFHIEYRLQDFISGILSKYFFDQCCFRYSMPSLINRYSICVPKDTKFNYRVTNGTIEPVIADVEDKKIYQWISTGQPEVKQEPFMSAFIDVVPTLTFSNIPDWTFVSEWYKDLTSNKFFPDFILKSTHAEILKGKENKSPLEKAKLFYEYILNNITYSNVPFMQNNFIPQKASRTITTRLGDCKDVSTLFVALCRESGIKANLVLTDTRNNGEDHLVLPSVSFNHCTAQLTIDDKIYYLELTDNHLPFASIGGVDLKAKILPIPYKEEKIESKLLQMNTPFRKENSIKRQTSITFEGNDMKVSHKSERFESMASALRQQFTDMGEAERLKLMNQFVAGDFTTPIKVSNLTFSNLKNLSDTAGCYYDIEVKNALQDVAGMKIFKLPWLDKFGSLGDISLEKREYPLHLWYDMMQEDSNTEQMEIVLAKGKKMVEVPQNVKLECENASYQLIFDAKTPGKLKVTRIMKRKNEIVSTKAYPAFREFMHAVSEHDNKQYAIR